MENFEQNISQSFVAMQNETRKKFENLQGEFERASEAYEHLQEMIFAEQKIRTKLEADLQVAQFAIRAIQEDVKDIQERLNEEFNKPKKSLFSFFKT